MSGTSSLNIPSNYIKSFSDPLLCISYITTSPNKKINLIILDFSYQNIISLIHDLQPVRAIYLLGSPSINDEKFKRKYYKYLGAYEDVHQFSKIIDSMRQEAHERNVRALNIRMQIPAFYASSLPLIYYNRGCIWFEKYYDKALLCFEKALELLSETSTIEYALILNNIGGIYHRKQEWNKALDYFEKAFDLALKIFPRNHPLITDYLNNISATINRRSVQFCFFFNEFVHILTLRYKSEKRFS
ncbi:unnamed protein product [Didymodactylos carnosus]|uniref:Uncharacterized protein n=1 Tax=Didymodactylos carnosus TaxID=1234261 RepID=A0A815IH92_9BILA|nr:unnamed protein product [Didymodactylos carnosus]CAF4253341.1 unnamed protein product [Didymodactylos carnosus]